MSSQVSAISRSETLVLAGNFEARSLKNVEVHFNGGYFKMDGFGVWDKAAQGWVSFSKCPIIPGIGTIQVQMPYSLRLKRYAEDALSQGIYADYEVVKT